jgi:hypothetical protein
MPRKRRTRRANPAVPRATSVHPCNAGKDFSETVVGLPVPARLRSFAPLTLAGVRTVLELRPNRPLRIRHAISAAPLPRRQMA